MRARVLMRVNKHKAFPRLRPGTEMIIKIGDKKKKHKERKRNGKKGE